MKNKEDFDTEDTDIGDDFSAGSNWSTVDGDV